MGNTINDCYWTNLSSVFFFFCKPRSILVIKINTFFQLPFVFFFSSVYLGIVYLGCVWIGWKWFSKILFRKCGCLVAHEKYIFRKCFSVLTCLWCKMISVFILHSNIIFRKIERESVCVWVRPRPRAKRERERERKKREPIAGDPRASTLPMT